LALGSPSWAILRRRGVVFSPLKIIVKINQKINDLQNNFMMRYRLIWEGKWKQAGTEMASKIYLNLK